MRIVGILLLSLFFLCSAGSLMAAQESIGSVISLEGSANALGDNGNTRGLELKSDVFLNDQINTKVKSKVQIMFDDDSVISQGENSEMTIDKYVYNPDDKDDNESTVKFKKGMFRVVSGEITKINPDRFKVKTRKATIGIRGCELGFRISEDRDDIYILYLPLGKDITIDAIGAIDQGLAAGAIQRSMVIDRSGVAVSIHKGGAVDERDMMPGEASAVFNDSQRSRGSDKGDDGPRNKRKSPGEAIDEHCDARRQQTDEDGDQVTYPPLPTGPTEEEDGAPSTSAPNTEPPIDMGGHPITDDWEWSITESGTVFYSPNRYLSAEFVPTADYANIAAGGTPYNLSGMGSCSAMLHDLGAGTSTLLSQGMAMMDIRLGNGVTPAWGGTFMVDNGPIGTDFLQIMVSSAAGDGGFTASGNLTLNAVSGFNMQLNGATYDSAEFSAAGTANGQLVRPAGGSPPITGITGEMHFFLAPNANADVAFGADLN